MGNAPAATDALILEHTLDQPVSGRVGLWSKDDSVALFQGFAVQAAD